MPLQRSTRNRRSLSAAQSWAPQLSGWSVSEVSSHIAAFATELPVQVASVPSFIYGTNTKATNFSVISANVFHVTFSASIEGGDVFSVPAYDPAVRTANGGYLAPGSVLLDNSQSVPLITPPTVSMLAKPASKPAAKTPPAATVASGPVPSVETAAGRETAVLEMGRSDPPSKSPAKKLVRYSGKKR